MDGMRPANIQGLSEGFEAFFGTPQGKDQLYLYLFCIHCRNNGTAKTFPNGQFAQLRSDHRNPNSIVQIHNQAFHQGVK